MKTKYWIYAAALIVLLVVLTTQSVRTVSASTNSLPELEGTPPPPTPKPEPGTPEPGSNNGNDNGGGRKTIIQKIFHIIFDYPTLADAIVGSLTTIFEKSVDGITGDSSQLMGLGRDISNIVFPDENYTDGLTMKEVRLTTWRETRKVAFALIPLVAALTVWASMKNGLYSVTGYANTLEAVAEFVVSVAIALASYLLMEQAIELANNIAVAIAYDYPVQESVFAGIKMKSINFATNAPVLAMIWFAFAFVFLTVFMGSVLIAFLAREVVLVLVVGMAPIMLILGAVRPLGWMRGLWAKAFFVTLLILPINTFVMGIAIKVQKVAAALKEGTLETVFNLVIMVGIISVLIAINTSLGKLVYGAALEVADKIKGTIEGIVAMGAAVGGIAIGVGALGAGGLSAVAGAELGGGLGGSGGGSLSGAVSSGADVTRTGQLSSVIGTALGGSSNQIVSSFGKGLSKGGDIKTRNAEINSRLSSSNKNLALSGSEEGFKEAIEQFNTDKKAASFGEDIDKDQYLYRAELGKQTAEVSMDAAANAGLLEPFFNIMGHEPGVHGIKRQAKEFTRAQASYLAISGHSANKFKAPNIIYPNQYNNIDPHVADMAASHQIIMNEHRNRWSVAGEPLKVTPNLSNQTVDVVRNLREQGNLSYGEIINKAANMNLQDWIDHNSGNL